MTRIMMIRSRIDPECPERGIIMSSQPIVSSLARISRRLARAFGYRFDHPAEVIIGFPPGAFR
jgi:hypothetical protein